MEQQKPGNLWISNDKEQLLLLLNKFEWFEDIAESSLAHLAYDVLDSELFLSPLELTTRWIDRVSRKVSLLLLEPEETLKMSGQKKEVVEDFRSFALRLFLWKIQELPFYKQVFIQPLSLGEANPLVQDRAIASMMRIPVAQFDSLIALLASEPAIAELMDDLEVRHIPGPKNDPKWGFFALHLSDEGYAKSKALKDQFSEIMIGTRVTTFGILENSEESFLLRRTIPTLHIPQRLADRYQLSYAPVEAVVGIRQRFINAFSDALLFKKRSFPTPRLPDFFGSKKPQMN